MSHVRKDSRQPATDTGSCPPDNVRAAIDAAVRQHHYQPDSLIEVLHAAQQVAGHLERMTMRYIAESLNLPDSMVYGVASFYHAFRLKPAGTTRCTVCTGTSCHIKGGSNLLQELSQHLGIGCGETSADGTISLHNVRCLGACGMAPLALVDKTIMAQATRDAVLDLIRCHGTKE